MNTEVGLMTSQHVYIFMNGALAGVIFTAVAAILIFSYFRRK